MADDPDKDLPPAATVEPEKEARTILQKGHVVTIGGKEFKLAMNTVITGSAKDFEDVGLKTI